LNYLNGPAGVAPLERATRRQRPLLKRRLDHHPVIIRYAGRPEHSSLQTFRPWIKNLFFSFTILTKIQESLSQTLLFAKQKRCVFFKGVDAAQ